MSFLAGYWIRESPEPVLLASRGLPDLEETEPEVPVDEVDYKTEAYQITDLFSGSEESAPATSTESVITSSTEVGSTAASSTESSTTDSVVDKGLAEEPNRLSKLPRSEDLAASLVSAEEDRGEAEKR